MVRTIASFIQEITSWKKAHPSAFFHEVMLHSHRLQLVIEAIVSDDEIKTFEIPLSSLHISRVSNNQFRIFKRYLDAKTELHQAKQELIKLFTSELN